MTIGIFYICTGRYAIFWKSFYESAERFFVTDAKKIYYVFTDSPDIRPADNIKIYPKKPLGFPLDSLLRFDMFDSIEEDTKVCDFLFFFNSNMQFLKPVTKEMILPTEEENGLVAVCHPGYYKAEALRLPYEKHSRSAACIPYRKNETYHYFMGGVNGGTYDAYYRLIKTCKAQIHDDMDRNVLALYHDESHLNHYLHGKKIKMLPPTFGTPEDSEVYPDPFIIILNKMKHGGKYFDKLPKTSYGKRLKFFLQRSYWTILWRMGILR